jgi:hypothetical protein
MIWKKQKSIEKHSIKTVRLDSRLHQKLKVISAEKGLCLEILVNKILGKHLGDKTIVV